MRLSEPAGLTAVQLLFLQTICNRPRGREAIKEIVENAHGGPLHKSVFVRLCQRMIEHGYAIRTATNRQRSMYEITPLGLSTLQWWAKCCDQVRENRPCIGSNS